MIEESSDFSFIIKELYKVIRARALFYYRMKRKIIARKRKTKAASNQHCGTSSAESWFDRSWSKWSRPSSFAMPFSICFKRFFLWYKNTSTSLIFVLKSWPVFEVEARNLYPGGFFRAPYQLIYCYPHSANIGYCLSCLGKVIGGDHQELVSF